MTELSESQLRLVETQADQSWSKIGDNDLPVDDMWVVVRDNNAYHSVHRFHPYFAMCPPPVARRAIEAFSEPGDHVLDPYAGAAVTMVEAMLTGRKSTGIDVPTSRTLCQSRRSLRHF